MLHHIPTSRNTRIIYIISTISIISNIVLFIVKLWFGIAIHSVAIVADAWHTLSDSFSSVIIIAAAWLANKPADYKHPYGHGRMELIAALFVGVLLVGIAFQFFMQAYYALQSHSYSYYNRSTIIMLIFSVIVKELMAQITFISAKKIGSPSLHADAWHHRSDALSTIIILAGSLFQKYFWWMDALLGFLVALIILISSYDVIRQNVSSLIGQGISGEDQAVLNDLAISLGYQPDQLHNFELHIYGSYAHLICHLHMDSHMTLEEVHCQITNLENAIQHKLGYITTIHPEC
jgi:cation diffusion facilitator family transporter